MHPADWKKLRELRPAPPETRPQKHMEAPKPMTKCPRDGTVFPLTEGVCPNCGDFA